MLLELCTRKSTQLLFSAQFGKNSVIFGLNLFICLREHINFQSVNVNKNSKNNSERVLPWTRPGQLAFQGVSPAIGQEFLQGGWAILMQELVVALTFWDCGDWQL